MIQRLSLLGTGLMGAPMARRLHRAGFTVTVWNRTAAKAQALHREGLQVAPTAADAVRDADVVVCMLEHGQAVASVLFGATEAQADRAVAPALPAGALVIDMGSIQPAEARHHAQRLADRGIACLDAPVSGGTLGAEAGTLAIMVGGEAGDVARAAPVFAPLGRATHVGPTGAGQLAKLANQMIVGITIGAVAEALLLAQRGGADPARVREALRGGFADSRILDVHGQRMVERDFAKRGSVGVQLKDLRNALSTGRSLGFDAPITALLEQLYADTASNGWADADQAGLWLELARRNGRSEA